MEVYVNKKRFEEALARRNMSQVDFAKEVGISETYLSMLKDPEKYGCSPSPDLREQLLKQLNLQFDDIFFISDYRYSGNFNSENTAATAEGGQSAQAS